MCVIYESLGVFLLRGEMEFNYWPAGLGFLAGDELFAVVVNYR